MKADKKKEKLTLAKNYFLAEALEIFQNEESINEVVFLH
jgi:hypothetical protein